MFRICKNNRRDQESRNNKEDINTDESPSYAFGKSMKYDYGNYCNSSQTIYFRTVLQRCFLSLECWHMEQSGSAEDIYSKN